MTIPRSGHEPRALDSGERMRRFGVLAGVALLWISALALPAMRVGGGPELRGVDVFLQGWKGGAHGILAWYANPLLAAALALAAACRFRAAAAAAGVATLLALSSTLVGPILHLQMSRVPALSLLVGFYAWLAAIVALLCWSVKRALARDAVRRHSERHRGVPAGGRD